jgi:hypothetical protein
MLSRVVSPRKTRTHILITLASSYINAPYRNTTYAPVLDGCKFGDNLAEEDGCSTIWLTKIVSYGRVGMGIKIQLLIV